MYRVIKEAGVSANVFIEDTELKRTINLGRITVKIIETIHEMEGFVFNTPHPDAIQYIDAWNLPVSYDTWVMLASKALTMKKPVRTKKNIAETITVEEILNKTKSEQTPPKKIDAWDVLFGRASYKTGTVNIEGGDK